jgi:hypothetical protein
MGVERWSDDSDLSSMLIMLSSFELQASGLGREVVLTSGGSRYVTCSGCQALADRCSMLTDMEQRCIRFACKDT